MIVIKFVALEYLFCGGLFAAFAIDDRRCGKAYASTSAAAMILVVLSACLFAVAGDV